MTIGWFENCFEFIESGANFSILVRLAGIEPTTLGFGGQTGFIGSSVFNHHKWALSDAKRQLSGLRVEAPEKQLKSFGTDFNSFPADSHLSSPTVAMTIGPQAARDTRSGGHFLFKINDLLINQ